MSVTLTLRLDADLLHALEDAAAKRRLTKSTLARTLIVEGLTRKRATPPASILAFAGRVEGPTQPATNAEVRRRMRSPQRT